MPDLRIPTIVYEDNHLLIMEKPSGWLVQGDRTGDLTLTDWGKEYLKEKYQKPGNVFLHPSHRLDRPVSGLVIFARTSKSLSRMNEIFKAKKIEKQYLAMVRGKVTITASLRNWLVKNEQKNVVRVYDNEIDSGKEAILKYQPLAFSQGVTLLLVMPETGRPHQIRAQLANQRHTILGDLKYGEDQPNPDKSISLHAFRLKFIHPVKKEQMSLISVPVTRNWNIFRKTIDELD